jgi:hypothetical protein
VGWILAVLGALLLVEIFLAILINAFVPDWDRGEEDHSTHVSLPHD